MRHARSMRWFQRLRWKLSLLYTSVTVMLIFIGVGISEVANYCRYREFFRPEGMAQALAQDAWQIAPYASATPANSEALALWMKDKIRKIKCAGAGPDGLYFYGKPSIEVAVADARGVALVSQSDPAAASVSRLAERLPPAQASLVNAALGGETSATRLSAKESDGALLAAAPIFDDKRQVAGALHMRIHAPVDLRMHFSGLASGLIKPLLTLITVALIGGVGFGLVTARHLVARLNLINTAAGAWSRGEFLAVADDSATDEIGQLAHRLNSMAKDLQGLLALRQELATMEERNRLARDLHDTVKQQVFALAMQIGAAQRISDGTSPEITKRLTEAERLTRQAQQELVAIIKELQPMDRGRKSFEQVLREQVADWSRQSGVTAEVNYEGASSLPRQVEQAFFRIAQEALANIARHSRATSAVVEVSAVNGDARLSIMDNGAGFDPGGASGGMGLQNMRARAEALPGGRFKIDASEAKGARVVAGCRTETAKKG